MSRGTKPYPYMKINVSPLPDFRPAVQVSSLSHVCRLLVACGRESKGKAASTNHQNRCVFLKELWEKVPVNMLAGDCYVSDHIRHPAI